MHALLRTVCAVLLAALAAQASDLTEKEAIRRFLAESPYSREVQAAAAVTRAETRGWSLWPNPSVGYSREGAGFTEFVQYEQQFPVSGRLGYLRRAGTAATEAAGSHSEHMRWQLISELRAAFYSVLAAQQREEAMAASLSRIEEVIRILRAREAEGEGSRYDRIRAEREHLEIEADLASTRVVTAEARSRLAAFFRPETDPAALTVQGRLEATEILPRFDEVLARSLAVRSDYAALAHEAERFRWQQQAAGRQKIPEPLLAGGIKRANVGSASATGSYFAISVPLPFFNRGQTDVERFRAEAQRVDARRAALEQRIRSTVHAAHAVVELRRRQSTRYRSSLERQEPELEQIAGVAYREGAMGILELLDAYRVSLSSRLRALEFQAAAKAAEIELERVAGEPVLNKGVLP